MRHIVKLVAINALVLFIVFNVLIWTICLATSVQNVFGTSKQQTITREVPNKASKARLPNYASIDWAPTHFREEASLDTRYVSYFEWRRKEFEGKTITIAGPYGQRRTVGPTDATKPSVYFFGGSTMWGTGADDANTIPSQFAQLSGFRAENFGELAYTAHQSLVLLIQVLQDGHRPNIVVFYDGVNEVAHKCRTEHTPWSHAREQRIAKALKMKTRYDLKYMVRPLMAVAYSVRKVLFGRKHKDESKFFNCHSDPTKAQKIADNLIEDWTVARKLVKSYNGKFVGILQPVSYFSKTKTDQIAKDMTDIERKQFQAVYRLIKQKMANRPGFYDFTDVLDKPEYIYIDFCHLSPNGNKYVAQKMLKTLEAEGTDELSQDRALRSMQAPHSPR